MAQFDQDGDGFITLAEFATVATGAVPIPRFSRLAPALIFR
jgi:hypothetical protein